MNPTLDFVSRARFAWQQFRSPSGFPNPRTEEEGLHQGMHQGLHGGNGGNGGNGNRRASAWPLGDTEQNPLNEFRLLVGIYQHKTFQAPHGFTANRRPQTTLDHRPAPNMGIYTTVCDSEIKCKRNYKMFSRLINGCLGLQIVVAAALTALGAANGSRSAVTVFGAINTIIAGFLTYLKGSGLPNRLKYFQHEWTKVREYIEQRERDFMLDSSGMNPYEEVDKVRQMYEIVKADIETNRPDRFVSVSALSNKPITSAPGPSLTRPQPSFSTDSFRKGWMDKEKEAGIAINRAQGTAAGLFSNVSHLKDVLEDKVKEIGHMEKEMESQGHRMVDEKKHGFLDQIQTAVKEVSHLGQEIQSKAKAAATEKELEAEQSMSRAAEAARTTAVQQRDHFNAAVADRQHEAQDAFNRGSEAARAGVAERQHEAQDAFNRGSEAARAGVATQRDNINTAIAEGRHEAQDAMNRGSEAARATVAQGRDNADAALSHAQDEVDHTMVRTSEAARAALQQQRDSLNAALADDKDGSVSPKQASPHA